MPKYNVVLRHNPSGKAASAARGRKIRTMGPYSSVASAKADAKALKTKKGIAVLVEPAAKRKRVAAKPRSSASMNRTLRKRTIKHKSTRRTGPSRGLHVGSVSNPGIPKTKTFGGKRYSRARKTAYKKDEAAKRQTQLRKQGYLARIQKLARGAYMVWCRKSESAARKNPKKKATIKAASKAKQKPKAKKSTTTRAARRTWRTGGPSRGLRAGIVTNPRRRLKRHAGPSTHRHTHRRHHAGAGVRGNPAPTWQRTPAGNYTLGHYAIAKERVISRGRRVQRWGLYKFSGSKWRLLAHHRTLTEAKAAAVARPHW